MLSDVVSCLFALQPVKVVPTRHWHRDMILPIRQVAHRQVGQIDPILQIGTLLQIKTQ